MADDTPGARAESIGTEDNPAQRQSDAPTDTTFEESDRKDGTGSSANGVPAFDEADGEHRKKLYKDGATLVSRMD